MPPDFAMPSIVLKFVFHHPELLPRAGASKDGFPQLGVAYRYMFLIKLTYACVIVN